MRVKAIKRDNGFKKQRTGPNNMRNDLYGLIKLIKKNKSR